MNPKTRITAIRLMQKISKIPEYAKKIGVTIAFTKKSKNSMDVKY